MLISIITPSFNTAKYIEYAIQNVLQQDYNDVEHIIIDGGSTDGTVDILKRYKHLRWISEPDHGQSDAMNKGVQMATGQIIGVLNADDFYAPRVLPRIAELAARHNVNKPFALSGNCHIFDDANNLQSVNRPKNVTLWNIYAHYYTAGWHPDLFPFNPSAYFYSRNIHQAIGWYDTTDHYNMDVDFLLRLLKHTPLHYYNEHWGNFRLVAGTKTQQKMETGESAHLFEQTMKKHEYLLSPIQKTTLFAYIWAKKQKKRFDYWLQR